MRWMRFWGFFSITYFALASATVAAEPLWLVREGRPAVTIVFGEGNDYPAERLQRFLVETTGVRVETASADGWQPSDQNQHAVVLIGTIHSNPVLRDLCGQLGLAIDPEELTEQGYIAKRIAREGRDWLILAGGGRDGSQYAVVDLFQWRLRHDDRNVWLDALDVREVPRFRYRWFWNWDNRMDWGGQGQRGAKMASGHENYRYTKTSEAFLVDGQRCIDFMADHKFNAMILWGFLRDEHGGVEASQALCRYAARRGVRILPGVGTSGYGGYYYHGENEFNSRTWLTQHPELRAIDKDGASRMSPCPSKQANQAWLDRGAAWLFETFDIGGVNLEMGDFFVCHCDDCRRARAAMNSNDPDYYKDMAISHGVTLKTMRRLAPEAWLSYATYTGFTAKMMETPPGFLSIIPEDAICQWTLTKLAGTWDPSVRPMARHNLGYLHWCNVASKTEHDFYLEAIRDICRNAAAAGFEGLDTYGELSDDRPNVEMAYLAWEAFLWNPEMTLKEFVDQRLARLYGGCEAADVLLQIIPLVQTQPDRAKPGNLDRALALADAAQKVSLPDAHQRWDRLLAYLRDQQEEAE